MRLPTRPRIKICGLTTVGDALRAVELGADYLGLNFYPPSPRCLSGSAARRIADAVGGRCPLVGVFAGQTGGEVERLADGVGLDLLQFHGDESAREIAPFAERAIKVFRVGSSSEDVDTESFENCWGILLDRRHDRLLGGTGEPWNWELAARLNTAPRLFVAGGIRPGLARHAAQVSGAWALDVCSGIEVSAGRKDWKLMQQLFEELEHAE